METYLTSYSFLSRTYVFLCDTIGVNAYTFKKAFLNISNNFEGETFKVCFLLLAHYCTYRIRAQHIILNNHLT